MTRSRRPSKQHRVKSSLPMDYGRPSLRAKSLNPTHLRYSFERVMWQGAEAKRRSLQQELETEREASRELIRQLAQIRKSLEPPADRDSFNAEPQQEPANDRGILKRLLGKGE